MNSKLASAFVELKKSGAKNLPSASVVEGAANGFSWKGAGWELTKNSEESYTCMIGQ
jgi:hypothetical protein